DKPRVFAEMYRVLRPGGRIGIADVIADDELTSEQRAERGSYVGCIAGALSFGEYERDLRAAGFTDISITSTHEPMPRIHSAIDRREGGPDEQVLGHIPRFRHAQRFGPHGAGESSLWDLGERGRRRHRRSGCSGSHGHPGVIGEPDRPSRDRRLLDHPGGLTR